MKKLQQLADHDPCALHAENPASRLLKKLEQDA
jgi:hypothetical protein